MTPIRRRAWLFAWLVVHTAVAAALLVRMPADAWFVSDPGAKYIATQNVLRHPMRPFETDLPEIPDQFARTLHQHFFEVHGDHAHAMTSQVFPVLSAPFVHLLGPIGLAVLPLVAWVLMGPLTAWLAEILGVRAPGWLVIATTAAATPFVFYGLEAWEHASAVALVLASAALVLAPGGGLLAGLLGGVCAAMAVELRPEAAAALAAVAIIALIRRRPASHLAATGAGLVLALFPFTAYNLAHFGRAASPHLAVNFANLSEGWWSDRIEYLTHWFAPSRRYMGVAFGVLAAGCLIGRFTRLRTAGLALCCFIVIGLAFEEARRHEVTENFFRVFPLGLLALIPMASPSAARRDLWIWCGVTFAGCLLTAPNDGGGQWGPRYLLPIVPALVCLGLDALCSTTTRRALAWATAAWVIVASLVVSYQAWHELREAKIESQRLVRRTASEAQGRSYVLTDVWWVGTYHAAVLDARRVIYVESPGLAAPLIDAIAPAELLIVTNPSAGDDEANAWSSGRCTVAVQPTATSNDPVRLLRLSCR